MIGPTDGRTDGRTDAVGFFASAHTTTQHHNIENRKKKGLGDIGARKNENQTKERKHQGQGEIRGGKILKGDAKNGQGK